MMASARALLFCAASAIVCCTTLISQEPFPAARIVDRINEDQLVSLRGSVHPAAQAKNDRGQVSADLPLTDLILVLSRSPEQQTAFDKFVGSQYDPTSSNFHEWLSAEEVGERFGPAQSDLDTVSGWLQSHGLSVDEVAKNRMTIRFSGTAAQVESAFHTEIHNLEVKGVAHIGNMTDVKIPAALAPAVVGVKALHNFFPRPLHRMGGLVTRDAATGRWKRVASSGNDVTPPAGKPGLRSGSARPQYTINDPNNNGPVEDVTPSDFAAIYNVAPLWNKGIDGTGQVIAIAGTSDIDVGQSTGSEAQSGGSGSDGINDVLTFRQAFGLPTSSAANTPKRVSGNSEPLTICTSTASGAACGIGDLQENTLDVEWSGAVAKNAQIVLVASYPASASDDNLFDSASYIVNNVTVSSSPVYGAHQMNVSYGECELGNSTAANVSYYNLWQTAAAEGLAVFVATGDSGSPNCDDGGDGGGSNLPYAAQYGLSVSGLASPPWDTAVGGTDLNWCPQNSTSACTPSPYWNSSNASTKASALGYVPEMVWNDTCTSPNGIFVAEYFANQLGVSGVTDGETSCNFLANSTDEQLIYYYFGIDVSGLVDVIGGSGGASGCVVNNTSSSYSNTALGTCTAGAGSTGNVTGVAGKTIASIPLTNNGWQKPSWQTNSKIPGLPSDGVRDIPDVSFFAADGALSSSAYLVCISADGSCTYSATSENLAQEIGGTSAASPAMAAVMALINQKAGSAQGSPNAELYALAAKQTYSNCSAESVTASSSCYFNDIDAGPYSGMPFTNAMTCVAGTPNCTLLNTNDGIGILSGYSATTGYDEASGLGSLNVANVVNGWPSSSTPAPVVSLTPTALPAFASTTVGKADAATQAITLRNTGTATLTGVAVSITGTNASSFSQTNTCGTAVAASAQCTITVTFKPAASGALSASVSVADNAAGSPQSVSISGTGTAAAAPVVSLTPTTLPAFASTTVGKADATTQAITLKNTGTATLTGVAVSITGTNASSFSQTDTCGTSVAASAQCTITVTFKPAASGALSAQVSVADNATGSPQTVSISGTGAAAAPVVSLTPATLPAFASTTVGVTDATTQAITLKNTGTATLSGIAVSIKGTNPSSFTQTNTCGSTLAASAQCSITVTFKPAASGALSAQVSVADNATGSPQAVRISGTGAAAAPVASLTPTTLPAFASTTVGVADATTQSVTLKNTGTAALTGVSISIAGTNASSFSQKSTCGTSLAVNASCTITVSFKPVGPGALSAQVSVADNASGSPQKVSLSGMGVAPAPVVSLTPATLAAFASTTVGVSDATTQAITLKNTGNATLTGVAVSIAGTNASSFSQKNACGSSLTASAQCTITVTFKPTAKGALSAKVSVADNATGSPQTVNLSGTGK